MRVSRAQGTLWLCVLAACAKASAAPVAAQEALWEPNLARIGDEAKERAAPMDPLPLGPQPVRPLAPPLAGAERPGEAEPLEVEAPLPPPAVEDVALPVPEEDAFAAPGIRIGTFMLRGSIDSFAGYDSNPLRTERGRGSAYGAMGAEATLTSDWSRHQLEARLNGTYTNYIDLEEANAPVANGEIRGRLDVRENIEIDGLLGIALDTLDPGDADTPQGLTDRPLFTEFRGLAGVTYRTDEWSFRTGGRIEHENYEDGTYLDGGQLDNSDRINTTYALDLRGAYFIGPKLEIFSEGVIDTRVHDREFDRNGLRRDSTGQSIATGLRYTPSALLDAEVSGGYRWRQYKDAELPDLSGFTADVSLTWRATALTTVRLTAGTLFDDTTLVDASGSISRFVRGEVIHALRRNVELTAAVGAETAEFEGIDRDDTVYTGELGAEWKFNRRFGVNARLAHTKQISNVDGGDFEATLYQLGIRFRY
ncbi:hypothetical protein GCM10007276_32320 [Agaricicola taiwanensis]|uniref:Outer membrane beta-barrel protein n=1 Tax=Agaricicola taiwanensis TaxID=591372 RepID=A0A8J2YMQ6_9RHOB|nr:outer membrane beta-barrel protein [Agaricicola taiwanensis]GGE52850.1 hypothetical protein GCM10007276_32320 [Agaricicola taiwanensis]